MTIGAGISNNPNIPNLWTNRKEPEYF
jgi:hypothetical protein